MLTSREGRIVRTPRAGGARLRVLAALGLVLLAGCARPAELRVPLDYRPTDALSAAVPKSSDNVVLAVVVTDHRTQQDAIGRNTEKPPEVPVRAAKVTPAEFVREGVSRELAKLGFHTTPDAAKATRIVALDLQDFWTDEGDHYLTRIRAGVEVKDAAGRALWQGQASGANDRFGRSLSAENYQETLSDATVDMLKSLLANHGFAEALTK